MTDHADIIRRARALADARSWDEAHALLSSTEGTAGEVRDRSGQPVLALERYRLLLLEGRLDAAAAFAAGAGIDLAAVPAKVLLARAMARAGRRDAANALWREVLRQSPRNDEALAGLGIVGLKKAEEPLLEALCEHVTAAASGHVFCVQVGANDGRTRDPVHHSVATRGWRGIMVEPEPSAFAALSETYAGVGVALENVAIGEADGVLPFYTPRSGRTRISSLSREHVERIEGAGAAIDVVEVRVTTLAALVEKHGVDRLDVLWVDAEGHDDTVVRSLPFDRVRPALIAYEHNNLGDRKVALEAFLAARGYVPTRLQSDTVAVPEGSPALPLITAYARLLAYYRRAVSAFRP